MSDPPVGKAPGELEAERAAGPFGREERTARAPGSEMRRAVVATLLGAALGAVVAVFSRRERE